MASNVEAIDTAISADVLSSHRAHVAELGRNAIFEMLKMGLLKDVRGVSLCRAKSGWEVSFEARMSRQRSKSRITEAFRSRQAAEALAEAADLAQKGAL